MKRFLVFVGLTTLLSACQLESTPTHDSTLKQSLETRYVKQNKTISVDLNWQPSQPIVTLDGQAISTRVNGKTIEFILSSKQTWGGPQHLEIREQGHLAQGTLNVLQDIQGPEANTVTLLVKGGLSTQQVKGVFGQSLMPLEQQMIPLGRTDGACGGLLVVAKYSEAEFAAMLTKLEQRAKENPDLILGINPATTWGLDQSMQSSKPVTLSTQRSNGLTGQDTLIAVLDTGVSANAEFGSRLLSGQSFTTAGQSTNSNDDFQTIEKSKNKRTKKSVFGHGTQVASLAAGKSFGVAPEAQILPVKVCDKTGRCRTSDILRGVCWAMNTAQQKGKLDKLVLNLSLGGPTGGFEQDALKVVLKSAIKLGVPVITSAGNQWPKPSKTILETYPHSYPAALDLDGMLAVGAVKPIGKSQKLTMSDYSNRGHYIDLLALGDLQMAVNSQGQSVPNTGTSFSAAQVSGAVARLKQKDPKATPQQIEQYLLKTADTTRVHLSPQDAKLVTNRLLDLSQLK